MKYIHIFLFFVMVGCTTIPSLPRSEMVFIKRLEKPTIEINQFKRIAVLDFDDKLCPGSGMGIASALVSVLNNSGRFDIVERNQIQKIMKEHSLNLTGAIQQNTIKDIGQLLGVDAIITGDALAYNVETTEKNELVESVDYGAAALTYIFTGDANKATDKVESRRVPKKTVIKSGNVSVNYRIIDIVTGKVVLSQNKSSSYNNSFTANIVPDGNILSGLLNDVSASFAQDICPHNRNLAKEFMPFISEDYPLCLEYVKRGDYQRASEILNNIILVNKNPAIYHNLGICSEALGDIDKAKEYYKQALNIEPSNNKYYSDVEQLKSAFNYTSTNINGNSIREFKIVQIDSDKIYIDAGSGDGIKVNDILTVYDLIKITNPDNGSIIDTDINEKAELSVVKVLTNSSLCKIKRIIRNNALSLKDRVKK